jgi:hypothetical protein
MLVTHSGIRTPLSAIKLIIIDKQSLLKATPSDLLKVKSNLEGDADPIVWCEAELFV